MTSTHYELDDIKVAPEYQGSSNGRVAIAIGGEVRILDEADVLDLAQALVDQLHPSLPEQVICVPPKGCGAAIMWMTTTKGRPTPVDPKQLKIISADGAYHAGYESHFASCPKHQSFRKGKKG